MKAMLETSKPPPISGLACVAMRKPLENILLPLWIPACLCPHLLIILHLNVSMLEQFVFKSSLALTAPREVHGGNSNSCTNLKVKSQQKCSKDTPAVCLGQK